MRRIRNIDVWALASGLALVWGCAGDADGNKRSDLKKDPFGNASPDGGAGDPAFGNSMAGSMATTGGTLPDGGQCMDGIFCKPTMPDGNCGTLTLKGDVKMVEMPGNVLIVFDRSGSMMQDWNGKQKWQAGGDALIGALQPIADKLTIGAVMFPSPDSSGGTAMMPACAPNDFACMFGGFGGGGAGWGGSCNVNPISAADQVDFKAGAMAISELMTGGPGNGPKYAPVMAGATPTAEGVKMADMALSGATLTGTTSVVLITDGEPNCMWDQAGTIAILDGWLKKNILTYVIGLPGATGGNGAAVLTALAQAGGTMDYITPTDTAALQMKLNQIVSQTVSVGFDSCTIHLKPAAMVPDKLQLVVTDKGVEQDVPHMFPGQSKPAWTITKDGTTVELLDPLCTDVKNGRFSQIRFTFGCMDLPPLPTPTPT